MIFKKIGLLVFFISSTAFLSTAFASDEENPLNPPKGTRIGTCWTTWDSDSHGIGVVLYKSFEQAGPGIFQGKAKVWERLDDNRGMIPRGVVEVSSVPKYRDEECDRYVSIDFELMINPGKESPRYGEVRRSGTLWTSISGHAFGKKTFPLEVECHFTSI